MCWRPDSREGKFDLIMVTGHPSPNSDLCVNPPLKWSTWLPRIHGLVKIVALVNQDEVQKAHCFENTNQDIHL